MTNAALENLVGYLAKSGGCDRFEFHDAAGQPDPAAARAFAENLRTQFGGDIGTALSVEQHANRVTVCAISEHAAL